MRLSLILNMLIVSLFKIQQKHVSDQSSYTSQEARSRMFDLFVSTPTNVREDDEQLPSTNVKSAKTDDWNY